MYDHGYMYPGAGDQECADRGWRLLKARRPSRSSAGWNTQALIADNPIEPPLDAKPARRDVRKSGDREIGAKDDEVRLNSA